MNSPIFTPKILYYANLYFFIQNLSEWHVSTRKKHNEAWRSELSFSFEAELCLQEFKKIHEQYSFGDNYLGRPFFLHNDPWSMLEFIIGKDDSLKIRNIFATLEPYFKTIYIKDEPRLNEWVEIIKDPKFTDKAAYLNKTLSNFYNCPPYNKNCTLYLLLSTEHKNGGTAGTIDNHSVTLELSHTSTKLEDHIIGVLWHELIHLYFKNFTLLSLLKKYLNNDWKIINKMDELIASALLPNGLLSQHKLTKINSPEEKNFNARIDSEKILQVQEIIFPYLQQQKSVNDALIEKLLEIK